MIDQYSQTWKEIEAWAETRLQKARNERERQGVEQRQMDHLLGSIFVLKDLLRLPERKEHQPEVETRNWGIPPLGDS